MILLKGSCCLSSYWLVMADIDPNFTCSDPELSRSNVTDDLWRIKGEGGLHNSSILMVAIFQIVFVLLGTPWSMLVLIAIIKYRIFKKATYILVMNLIIAGLLVCVLIFPFNIASGITQQFTLGSSDYTRCLTCHVITMTLFSLILVSLNTLALMSLERLIYLMCPLRYLKYKTAKRVIFFAAFHVGAFYCSSHIPEVWVGRNKICKFTELMHSYRIWTKQERHLFHNHLLYWGHSICYSHYCQYLGYFNYLQTILLWTLHEDEA